MGHFEVDGTRLSTREPSSMYVRIRNPARAVPFLLDSRLTLGKVDIQRCPPPNASVQRRPRPQGRVLAESNRLRSRPAHPKLDQRNLLGRHREARVARRGRQRLRICRSSRGTQFRLEDDRLPGREEGVHLVACFAASPQ